MNLLLGVGFSGGLVALPIIGAGVTAYCIYRYKKTKSLIPLGVGILFGALTIAAVIIMALEK
jgi:hypothetical protein